MNKTTENIVTETYDSLSDYMTKNGYPVVALLESNHTESDQYGITADDINYSINIYTR